MKSFQESLVASVEMHTDRAVKARSILSILPTFPAADWQHSAPWKAFWEAKLAEAEEALRELRKERTS
jgi:hypothetical protein